MFNNKYPYTDFHELNLDWLLNQVTDLQTQVKTLIDQYKSYDDLLKKAAEYTDMEVAKLRIDVVKNSNDLVNLDKKLGNEVTSLRALIADEVDELNVSINTKYIRTQQMITQQWEDMKNYIADQVYDVKVLNFFTGQIVSIQSMFDYLAGLHLTDSGTYAQVSGGNTYNYYIAKNENYTDVILSSRTFFNS